MPQSDWTKRREGESWDAYLKRVSTRIKKDKTTDWDVVEREATQIVKEIRRDKGEEGDKAILREIDPGYRYTPKKRKKKK